MRKLVIVLVSFALIAGVAAAEGMWRDGTLSATDRKIIYVLS